MTRHPWLLAFILFAGSDPARAAAPPPPSGGVIVPASHAVSIPVVAVPASFIRDNSLLFSFGGISGLSPGQHFGGFAGIGFQFRRMALDVRATAGALKYGAISVSPGPSDYPPLNDDGTTAASEELDRARTDLDAWSYLQLEPGISVTGQLFADRFPRLAERGRFGLGAGKFTDQANSLEFYALTASFEADLEYQLAPSSRWSVRFGATWETGVLRRTDDLGSRQGRLPVSWAQASLSMLYAL